MDIDELLAKLSDNIRSLADLGESLENLSDWVRNGGDTAGKEAQISGWLALRDGLIEHYISTRALMPLAGITDAFTSVMPSAPQLPENLAELLNTGGLTWPAS